MSVYVDRAANPLRRMIMCHMIADTLDELHAMAERIGLSRRWFQAAPPASFPHYDVARGKRGEAIAAGAIECDRRAFVGHMQRIRAGGIRDIVTYCPKCGELHLDVDEWRDKPHRTHLCLKCGALWRPVAECPTRGVAPDRPLGGRWLDGETIGLARFEDDYGQVLWRIHGRDNCKGKSCTVHRPSAHRLRGMKLLWRQEARIFERVCAHGVGHPDPDCYMIVDGAAVPAVDHHAHGCDGCCAGAYEAV